MAVKADHEMKLPALEFATADDVEAVAEVIELVDPHSSEHYARAAILALEARGWRAAGDR